MTLLLLTAAAAAAAGFAAGRASARGSSDGVNRARAVWTSLRAGQTSEYLSWVLYQLREYLISTTSLVETIALSAPKEDHALAERLERLKKVVSELNAKSARILGEKSGLTTQAGKLSSFHPTELVRETVADAQAAFGGANTEVTVTEAGEIKPVTCERKALRLSLLAVLQNSLEACALRGGGRVSVVVRERETHAEIEVMDDGGGLAVDPATVFEPFYGARKGSQGVGLGLPMARRMLERLGGTARVKSKDGATAVLLEFPIQRELPFVRNSDSTWAGRRRDI